MVQQKWSWVPYYIENLYRAISKIKNNILFFQTQWEKKLWTTYTFPCSAYWLMWLLFDTILVLFFIYKYKPTIFHGPSFILPLRKPQWTKYIVTIHDLSVITMPHLYKKSFSILYKRLIKKSIAHADRIIAVSHHTKHDIIKYYTVKSEKIIVLYPWINPIFMQNTHKKRLLNEKYIVSITTHPKRKNILSVIESLAHLKKNNIIIRYVIVGIIGEQQKKILQNKINELKLNEQVSIRWYATEEELLSLYQNAELFIYPSFYEWFWFPIIEAMASKTLVITSNSSSMKELVTDNNFLVDPYSINDIANKIEYALNLSESEKNVIIEKNYQFIKQFNRETIALQFSSIVNNISPTQ